MPTSPRYSTRGFSLLELLVVTALVIVLIALVAPAYSLITEAGRATKCVSNLRQVGAMVLAYTADNNGYMMPRNAPNASYPEDRYWSSRLIRQKYITGNFDVFYCPSFFPYNNRTLGINDIATSLGQCYGMRDWRNPGDSTAALKMEKKLLFVEKPSDFFMLGDSYSKQKGGTQWYSIVPDDADQNSFIHLRHRGKSANLFFLDGSVRNVTQNYIDEINTTQRQYGRGTGFRTWF